MGWWLHNSKKKRQRKRWSWPDFNRWHALVVLKLLLASALAAGGAWLWLKTEDWLAEYATARQSEPIGPDRVRLVGVPDWMGPSIRRELCWEASRGLTANPLDQAGLNNAATAVRGSAWLRQLRQLRRTASGQVIVEAEFRQPVAIVQARDGYHLVDADCVRLPGLYLKHTAGRLEIPMIVGVSRQPARPGNPWASEELAAGVALVCFLESAPYLDQIRSIDVSGRDTDGRVHLVLRTPEGRVHWGLPPGQEFPYEPDASEKKRLLALVAARHEGSIDAHGQAVEIFDGNILLRDHVIRDSALPTGYTY